MLSRRLSFCTELFERFDERADSPASSSKKKAEKGYSSKECREDGDENDNGHRSIEKMDQIYRVSERKDVNQVKGIDIGRMRIEDLQGMEELRDYRGKCYARMI